MKVTRETRERTRLRILDSARKLFADKGFEASTTRAIAAAAGIAAGTLFNYFRGKEELGLALLSRAVDAAEGEFRASLLGGESLEEQLFLLVAIQLRHLQPARAWLGEVLEAGLSPLRADADADQGFRGRHLELVDRLLAEHVPSDRDAWLDRHLYWTLYLGVLSFWARDDSDQQEASLAFLDRSTRLFCHALREGRA